MKTNFFINITLLFFVSCFSLSAFSQSGNIIYNGLFLRPGVAYDSDFSYKLGLHKGYGWVGWDTFSTYGAELTYNPVKEEFGTKFTGITSFFVLLGAELDCRLSPETQNMGLNLLAGWNFNTIFNDFSHLQIYYARQLTVISRSGQKNPKHAIHLALYIPLKINVTNKPQQTK